MQFKSKNKINATFSMASMTDIIFLLLIFFLITSNVTQNALDVTLPKAKGSTNQQQTTVVTISNDNRFYVGEDEFLPENLEGGIVAQLREKQDSTFVVMADKDSKYENVIFVMSLANRNQYKVVLATDPENAE